MYVTTKAKLEVMLLQQFCLRSSDQHCALRQSQPPLDRLTSAKSSIRHIPPLFVCLARCIQLTDKLRTYKRHKNSSSSALHSERTTIKEPWRRLFQWSFLQTS
jgi:hypothetical protein